MSASHIRGLSFYLLAVCLLVFGVVNRGMAASEGDNSSVRQIIVPGEDRFMPFAITIRVGQKVTFINRDADDHTVVSNDAFNTAGHRGVNMLLKANGGKITLTFKHAGVFPFYCRFHSVLDAHNQPKAPGPDGGIQDANGNFGTPMNGVITVLAGQD
jgi:plastocyanin